jgi:PAS domain S-box-containing protein
MPANTDPAEFPLFDVLIDQCGRIGGSAGALLGTQLRCLSGSEQAPLPDILARLTADRPVISPLRLQGSTGQSVPVLAALWPAVDDLGEHCIRVVALDEIERDEYVRNVENRAELLAAFIDVSTEAMWCMEYTEPVDLSCGVNEIIRQVFENDCHWRMCNAAMAKLYNLPDGLDFNRQPVSAYFRRTPENEAFVRQLIDARFHIDAAPSLEYRHDGKIFYVENSVRCHIEGSLMIRMWGTVRDITEFQTAQNALAARKREVTEILTALPDAVLVVDLCRRAMAVNPAFESTFGWTAEQILGNDVTPIIDLESSRPGLGRWFAPTPSRWVAEVVGFDGQVCRCDVRIAPLPADTDRRYVLVLRPLLPDENEVDRRRGPVRRVRKGAGKSGPKRNALRSTH